MARKRDTKPRSVPSQEEDLSLVFSGMDGRGAEQRESYGEASDGETPEEVLAPPDPSPAPVPAANAPPEEPGGSVSSYLRSQVLRELYGTDSPSDYDRISLAIRKRL